MIYSSTLDKFPTANESIEIHSYFDDNQFEWKIARVESGFFIGYFGDKYFMETYLKIYINAEERRLKNTGCFFMTDTTFETFYRFRTLLKEKYTDDIWEKIQQMLTQRFLHDSLILECEIIS